MGRKTFYFLLLLFFWGGFRFRYNEDCMSSLQWALRLLGNGVEAHKIGWFSSHSLQCTVMSES